MFQPTIPSYPLHSTRSQLTRASQVIMLARAIMSETSIKEIAQIRPCEVRSHLKPQADLARPVRRVQIPQIRKSIVRRLQVILNATGSLPTGTCRRCGIFIDKTPKAL